MSTATLPDGARIILEGVTGSRAYGLDTEASDTDLKGVHVIPLKTYLGISQPDDTVSTTDPDVVYHELGKFCRLAAQGNPTVLETLWLDEYTHLALDGGELMFHRDMFLSDRIRKTYGGYAISQVEKLKRRGDFGSDLKARYSKHVRHCFRLLIQGAELLETGEIRVKLTPEERGLLFWLGEQSIEVVCDRFEVAFAAFDAIPSHLPDEPDYDRINGVIAAIRMADAP